MNAENVIEILESDCIDDAENLLNWLAVEGLEILKEYVKLKAVQPPLIVGATSIPTPCPFHLFGTDGVHIVVVDRCSHPDAARWRETPRHERNPKDVI